MVPLFLSYLNMLLRFQTFAFNYKNYNPFRNLSISIFRTLIWSVDPGQFGSILDPHVFRTRLWMSSSWIPVGQKFDSLAEKLDWEKNECSQFKWNNTLFMFQVHFCLFHKYDHPLKILQYQHPVGYEYQIITCNLIPKGSLRYFICWK